MALPLGPHPHPHSGCSGRQWCTPPRPWRGTTSQPLQTHQRSSAMGREGKKPLHKPQCDDVSYFILLLSHLVDT